MNQDLRFEKVFDLLVEGVQLIDFNWSYLYVNDTYTTYQGQGKETIIGRTLMDRLPGIESTAVFQTLKQCMEDRVPQKTEVEYVYANSSEKRWFELTAEPVETGILVLTLDITSRKEAEQKITENENRFRHTLDHLLEGIQIHDFDWRYVYVNPALLAYSQYSEKELIGYTPMERYPGIEKTPVFAAMKRSMEMRTVENFETEFNFPNGTKAYFDVNIHPVPGGIAILSVDRSEQKKSKDRLIKMNRLYAFISAINQSIVHVKDEQVLLDHICKVAVTTGQFRMASVNMIDEVTGKLNVVSVDGPPNLIAVAKGRMGVDANDPLLLGSPTGKALSSGKYFISNNVQQDPGMEGWRPGLIEHEIRSFMAVPVKKFGKVVGTVGFLSGTKDFFDKDEIALLDEAVSDISFALENLEKERRHRHVEALVLKNEARFRALIEKSADVKTLATREGKYVYCSPGVRSVLGYTPEEMENTSLFGYIHPDDVAGFTEQRKAILDKPGAWFFIEQRRKHKNGTWIWCEETVTNQLHDSGIEAMVSNFHDITAKKDAEHKQEFDKNNLDALINNTHDLMWSVDLNFNLITFNEPFDNALRLSGRTLAKGESVLKGSVSPEQAERFRANYTRAFAGETFTVIEYSPIPEDFWMEVSYNPIRKGSEIIGAACFSRDITAKKKIEQVLIDNNEQLQKTNKELDRFVYSASHDLRSPLTSILGLVQFIERDSRESDTLEYTRLIRESVNRLDGFIKNILSYSRNNRTDIEPAIIPLQKTITEAVNALKNMKEAQEIRFEVDINESVPFYSDMHRFCIVMDNLISNAIKFRHEWRDEKFVRIKGMVTADYAVLQVEDNGIGINPEYHEKIFNMFFRVADKKTGSGIGLYIVKETVEKLQGSITVESKAGEGTIFNLTLKNFKNH